MEASQREKYKSGPFTKQRDTKYRGEGRGGKKEMEKNAVDCNRYRNEGRGRGGVDKRYRPRGGNETQT